MLTNASSSNFGPAAGLLAALAMLGCLGGPEVDAHENAIRNPTAGGAGTRHVEVVAVVSVADQHGCSGTILNRFTVLTAKHCTTSDGPYMIVDFASSAEGTPHRAGNPVRHPTLDLALVHATDGDLAFQPALVGGGGFLEPWRYNVPNPVSILGAVRDGTFGGGVWERDEIQVTYVTYMADTYFGWPQVMENGDSGGPWMTELMQGCDTAEGPAPDDCVPRPFDPPLFAVHAVSERQNFLLWGLKMVATRVDTPAVSSWIYENWFTE